MKRARFLMFVGWIVAMASLCVVAQEGPLDSAVPTGLTPEQIIQKFTAKEKQFKSARKRCTYRQTIKMQALDGTEVIGEYQQVADIRLDQNGKKVKNVVFAPQPSMSLSPEDSEDMEGRLYFTISTDELPDYDLLYKGQQQEDDLHCYVFDVSPKKIEKGKRYFQGRIWVDDHDFQIVRMAGKSVPDIYPKKRKGQPNLFPKYTTYRQVMDGKYWYPTYSLTDDTLHFPGKDIRMKGVVKATDFKCADPEVLRNGETASGRGKSAR